MKKYTRTPLELKDGDDNGHVRVLKSTSKGGPAIGLDVGDRYTHVSSRDEAGEIVSETRIRTTMDGLRAYFEPLMRCRVALEVGTHSRWMSSELEHMGFEVYVANARKLRAIYQSDTKTDKCDANFLSEIVSLKPDLLCPVKHRGERAQTDLALIRARAALVRSRTLLINHVRTTIKAVGARLATSSAGAFHKQAGAIPDSRQEVLDPLMNQIGELTANIRGYNKRIRERVAAYPEAALVMQVSGVGPVVALAFICTIEDPHRFRRVRTVGSYLGLRPRIDRSGRTNKELGITKAGDSDLRRLLVNSAQYIIGPLSPDCDLKRVDRGGTAPKKKAAIAVARKLAVVLLSLWKSNSTYDPLRESKHRDAEAHQQAGAPVAAATCPIRKTPSVMLQITHKPTSSKAASAKSTTRRKGESRTSAAHLSREWRHVVSEVTS